MFCASRPGFKKKWISACLWIFTYVQYLQPFSTIPYKNAYTNMPSKMPMYKTVGTNKLTVVRISDMIY